MTAAGRVLPFSQVAPGIDTPTPIGGSAAPRNATGATAGAATGAATSAAGHAGAQAETAAQAQARRRLEKMWATSKSSRLAFRARVRGSKPALPYNNIILWVVSLL